MGENIEFEAPINCMKRLTQKDDSEQFDIFIKFPKDKTKENKIRTTLNKARVISNKINQMYQIDPTIQQYELIIPEILSKTNNANTEEQLQTISKNIEIILKSTTEKINISKIQKQQINVIQRLLGESNDTEEAITINSINEAISYLSTEFHPESIKYLAIHLKDLIDENQISNFDKEIIDSYFNEGINKEETDEKREETKYLKDYEEIFDKIKNIEEPEIVFHFLLQIDTQNYTNDMREYITNNISDDIISSELNLIIRQFIQQLKTDGPNKEIKTCQNNSIKIEYTNSELNGIISHLKTKYGENLIEQGIIKINDKGNFHNSSGSLSNLIKYDSQHIDEYYRNNGGSDPLPTSTEGWIEFDFMERKINLTSYTIRNCYDYCQKSWRILGSNDRNEWEVINQQTNNTSLNSYNAQHRFECENKHKYYRYIRYIQDDSWRSDRKHNVYLTCIEFFGSIAEK